MTLLPNEQTIRQSTDNQFMLTNFRIVQKYSWWFNTNRNSIFLEDISSLERYDRNWLILLILGVLLSLYGISMISNSREAEIGVGAFILGVVLILIWRFTRRTALHITPDGGRSIIFYISKASSNVEDIIFNIELAKINRIQQLYNSKF
ncbi:MAG: hypothetical protein WBA61_14115 [Aequorivita sp.]